MRQYQAIKQAHPGCVLFFRMGDFYEMFGDDAEKIGRALGLTISSRSSPIPMCGVPHHQLPTYLQRAVDAGFRVAVVDQLEDPAQAKGVVQRGVTQVVTPGTLVDASLLADEATLTLAAVCFDADDALGLAIAELSTGAFWVLDTDPARAAEELARRSVREVLYAEHADGSVPPRLADLLSGSGLSSVAATPRAAWHFRPDEAVEAIRTQYRAAGVEGFGLLARSPSVRSAGAVLRYLHETQATGRATAQAGSSHEFLRQHATLDHLRPPRAIQTAGRCRLDAVTLRALEVERVLRPGASATHGPRDEIEGSLLGVFLRAPTGPRCVVRTPMGKRLLREWLVEPLCELEPIRVRQARVAALSEGRALAEALDAALEPVADLPRIAGRVALGRVTPRDLVALGGTLASVPHLAGVLDACPAFAPDHAELSTHLSPALASLGQHIAAACVDAPPPHLREGGLIRPGVDAELDEARALQHDAGAWLADYQARLTAQFDLPSLKVGFNKVFGYFIELPSAQARRAPPELTRTQTLKNAERYTTPELHGFERKVTTAQSRAIDRERALFDQLCAMARAALPQILRLGELLAELDVLAAFAAKARLRGWVRPEIVDEPVLRFHAGRHPVLDETLGHRFVPNDAELGTPDHPQRLGLITGPNMAGKSTFIRQNALLTILALTGSSIPADRAVVGLTDRVFTRVGADDALHRGQSTFMVEMTETATILNNATPRSLVVLDEIGRGTSTLDGLSLAWAIVEALAGDDAAENQPAAHGLRTLFATHYHELTDLADRPDFASRIRNLHVAVNEWTTPEGRSEVVFLHQIRPGRADRSYGVHVAELAGVPRAVVDRARAVLESLSVHSAQAGPAHGARADTARVPPRPAQSAQLGQLGQFGQLGLFTEFIAHPAVDRLRELKLEALSPIQAFDLLRELKAQADSR
jgi:DNA mismatch repair protein MutS